MADLPTHEINDSSEPSAGPIVGIDLGTTNSLVAVCDERGPRILEDPAGGRLLPSVVRFDPEEVVIGTLARDQAVLHPERTVSSAKRLMGRGADELEGTEAFHGAPIVAGPRGLASIQIGSRVHTPQEVAAHILGRLRAIAEDSLGRAVTRAVITVPPTSTMPREPRPGMPHGLRVWTPLGS